MRDYYLIEEELSPEERAVAKVFRQFTDTEILPRIGELWLKDEFPMDVIPKLVSLGALGCWLPKQWGGVALNPIAYGLMMQELERGDSGIRSFVSVQNALVMFPIYTYGSEEQKKAWLPRLMNAEAIGCFGLTEPEAGSDPGSLRTIARKSGNEWILRGGKTWITNGGIAELAVIWAKEENTGTCLGFLVEKGMPGFRVQNIERKVSLKASVTSTLYLDDVKVSESHRLPLAEGFKAPFSCLTEARYGIAWGGVGAAISCFEEALTYAKTRIQFQKPIASFQLIQYYLVDILQEITKAQLLVYQLGRLKQKGKATFDQISLAKRNNVKMALETARTCRSILGASGITTEYHSIRHACNLESVYTYEGSHEIQSLIVGRALTGLDAIA